MILVLAAMMTRTLQRVLSDDLGFEYEQAAVLQPGLGRHGFDSAGAIAYWNAVKARVRQQPETAALALALAPPLGGRVRDNTYDDAPGLEVVSNSIEPAFFEVMEIPLVRRTDISSRRRSGDDRDHQPGAGDGDVWIAGCARARVPAVEARGHDRRRRRRRPCDQG